MNSLAPLLMALGVPHLASSGKKRLRRKPRPCINPDCNKLHDNKNSFCCAKCHAEVKRGAV